MVLLGVTRTNVKPDRKKNKDQPEVLLSLSDNSAIGDLEVKWFANFILLRAKWVALIGTLLALIGGYYSVQLYKNLRTDIQELLPTTARSVIDLKEVTDRLESIDNLAVLIFSKNTRASKRFCNRFGQNPGALPQIHYRQRRLSNRSRTQIFQRPASPVY